MSTRKYKHYILHMDQPPSTIPGALDVSYMGDLMTLRFGKMGSLYSIEIGKKTKPRAKKK